MTTAHRGLIGIAGLLWALQGCFSPTPPAGVLCAPDGWCPDGQSCDPFTWMCVASEMPDAGTPWNDSGWPWPPDAAPWTDGGLRTGIDEALISYGPVNIQIPEVLVTYVKRAETFEPAGFFVQGEQYGPALFVGVDPDLGGTRLQVGDRVSFRLYEMSDIFGLPMALNIADIVIHGRGESVDPLIQDITDDEEFELNTYLYVAELVSSVLAIRTDFVADGDGVGSFEAENDVISWMRLRVPDTLQDVAGLEVDCYLRVPATPVWQYFGQPYLLAYDMDDLEGVNCPPARIEAITVEDGALLRIELSRAVNPATLAANGSQFVFDGGLAATSATASGRVLTVTTTAQVDGQLYNVTIDSSLQDVFGAAMQLPGNSRDFVGLRSRARVRINEVKANIEPGCDLVELRVVEPGSLSGFDLRVQNSLVLTFTGDLTLETNDLVVVHFDSSDGSCRRAGSSNETQATNEQPRSVYPANFDTAYDWYTPNAGPADGPSVLAVRDDEDRILDAVLLTDGLMQPTSSLTENAAALVVSAGQWQSQSGGVPPGGFVDAAFHDSAAPGINVDPADVTGGFSALDGLSPVQRSGNGDTDRRGDWGTAAHTFGIPNAGQNPL